MQNSLGEVKYTVDLVFCIDATESMKPVLDKVKDNALNFYTDLLDVLKAKKKKIDSVRIKIIAFRDYYADEEHAMLVTDFFNMPDDLAEFALTIRGIVPDGGGDIPEDALEALGYAIRSEWNRDKSKKKRQVIVLWTDAPAHPIGFSKTMGAPNYPSGMARSFSELTEWWENEHLGYIDYKPKRLVLFAPVNENESYKSDEFAWENIVNNWNNVIYFPSVAGRGMEEFKYNQILDVIANTV